MHVPTAPVSGLAKTSDQCAAWWENLCGCLFPTLLLMLLMLRCCFSLPCVIIPSSSFPVPPEVLSACSLGKSLIFCLTSSGNFHDLQVLFLFIPRSLHPPNLNICNTFLRNSSVSVLLSSVIWYQPMISLTEQFKLSVIKIIPCWRQVANIPFHICGQNCHSANHLNLWFFLFDFLNPRYPYFSPIHSACNINLYLPIYTEKTLVLLAEHPACWVHSKNIPALLGNAALCVHFPILWSCAALFTVCLWLLFTIKFMLFVLCS